MDKIYKYFFIIIVLIVLLIPITKFSEDDVQSSENRHPSPKAVLFSNSHINLEYTKQFDNWLNDRFRYRNNFLDVYKNIELLINNHCQGKLVFLAENGWFFLKVDNSIENYQNKNLFSIEEMKKIKMNITYKRELLKKYGIDYYIMIVPDKNRVYPEMYPNYINKYGEKGRAELLVNYLHNNGIDVVYPLEELFDAKDIGYLYYKTDAHWNTYGAFIGYNSIMKRIKKDYSDIKALLISEFDIKNIHEDEADYVDTTGMKDPNIVRDHKWHGDLAESMYMGIDDLDISDNKTLVLSKKDMYSFVFDVYGDEYHRGRADIFTSNEIPINNLNVTMLRDSFTMAMLPYIAESFNKCHFIWSNDFCLNYKKIINDKPDIVIEEIGERNIGVLLQEINIGEVE